VSIRGLEEATGLKAGSIYNSFGDKEGLFRAAFAHYVEFVLKARIAEHAPPESGFSGLRTLFISLMHEPDDGSLGCLITNSAIEFGGKDVQPAAVHAALEILAIALRERLAAAAQAGTLAGGIDVTPASARLLALYQGILVLVRAGWDKPALQAMVNAEFDQLEGKHHVA
jgi:TetR/AcrR family transcriptional regulator, transcriptional repressor for nem operon